MSTFEKVRKNIERDMARSRVHTAESWANIMLQNTNRLTNVQEQHRFWKWMSNPEEREDIPDTVVESMEHTVIETPEYVTVSMTTDDKKSTDVEMVNEYFRNGQGMFIKTMTTELAQSRVHPSSSGRDDDEKTIG